MAKTGSAKTLAEDIYQRIRSDILGGRLVVGQRLKLASMAADYGVSLNIVREALSHLASDKLVKTQPQQGFSVTALTAEELQDLTFVRVSIESLALARAIEHGGVDWEAALLLGNGSSGRTPAAALLLEASLKGQTEIADLLIANGADVNARDGTGATPLHHAAGFGNLATMKLLLDHGHALHERSLLAELCLLRDPRFGGLKHAFLRRRTLAERKLESRLRRHAELLADRIVELGHGRQAVAHGRTGDQKAIVADRV